MAAAGRAAALALAALFALACAREPPLHDVVRAAGDQVRIALDRLNGEVRFFTFLVDDRRVNFLVRTDGSGRLQAHLDACFSCYRYKRGFVVEGDAVVCIACRYAYRIEDEQWDYIGACAPIPIRSKVEGDSLVIRRAALARAARYF